MLSQLENHNNQLYKVGLGNLGAEVDSDAPPAPIGLLENAQRKRFGSNQLQVKVADMVALNLLFCL
jgi:hypothetical protein